MNFRKSNIASRNENDCILCSLDRSDEDVYKRVCRPQILKGWEKLDETPALLPTFKCPTVIRITSARGLNIREVEGYAKLIEKAKPTYVEAKRTCTSVSPDSDWAMKSMPSHDEIREFSTQLARETGYNLIDESIESRVVLLSKLRNSMRFGAG